MKIGLPEVVAALDVSSVEKLAAMWTLAAAVRCSVCGNGVDWVDADKAAALCMDYGCSSEWAAVMRHVDNLPANQRGFVQVTT